MMKISSVANIEIFVVIIIIVLHLLLILLLLVDVDLLGNDEDILNLQNT